MTQDNRESWLNRVAAGMAPLFEALDAPLPSRVRVAIGFTSAGRKGKAIGECWDNRLSADGHFEIFIRPDLAHAPDAMPSQIAAILAHELVHAAVGIPAGHGAAFKRVALGLGLVGPMRATTPGEAFLAAIVPILDAAGPLPHARLDTDGESTAPRKQKTRMLKCECATCGYTVRTARKWLEQAGAPLCPIEGHGVMEGAFAGGGGILRQARPDSRREILLVAAFYGRARKATAQFYPAMATHFEGVWPNAPILNEAERTPKSLCRFIRFQHGQPNLCGTSRSGPAFDRRVN